MYADCYFHDYADTVSVLFFLFQKTYFVIKRTSVFRKAGELRGVALSIVLVSLFLSLCAFTFSVQPAEALYSVVEIDINADGSVTPEDAPVVNVDNTFYTLTEDVNITGVTGPYNGVGIRIMRSNIVFNGNGHTITNGAGYDCFAVGYGPNNVTIANTTAIGFNICLYLEANNCTVKNNTFSSNGYTDNIRVRSAGDNYFEGNNITNTGGSCIWMYYWPGLNNTFVNNYIVNSGGTAIGRSLGGGGSKFYHNIIGGGINAYYTPACTWDNGYPSGGNYWIGHTDVDNNSGPYQNITGPDGIWDHALVFDDDDIDHYPFVVPYETEPPVMTVISPENKTYAANTGIPLTFTVDESTRWMGYSLDGQANVTITGNATLPALSDGPHYVFVYANDTFGNMGKTTTYFTVDATAPTADAGSDQAVDEDSVVTFDGSASTDENGVATYTWTFTDGTSKTLTGENPTYTFTTPGTYLVTLVVRDAAGNTATQTVTITVHDVTEPVADAGQDQTVDVGATVSFDAGGSADNVGIVSYDWDFGDESSGTGKTTTHEYTKEGTYTVTLTVKDAAGNQATNTMLVTVNSAGAFPSSILLATGIVAAAMIILFLIFWKRRKKKKTTS